MKLYQLALLSLIFAVFGFTPAQASHICDRTANLLRVSCGFEASEDYFSDLATCLNISHHDDRSDCVSDAKADRLETIEECSVVKGARKDVCDLTGQQAYEPEFGEDYAANFVNPLDIGGSVSPNPYFPMVQGNTWTYEKVFEDDEGEEVTETILVTVTGKTKVIEGITCVTINDIADEGGEVIEDTDDWYAQDIFGNLWYCGEIAENFETFEGDDPEEAELVDIEGSWKAGRDGAKAGILFPANPYVGETIRQEVLWGDAEDVITIESLTGTQVTPAASCDATCLVTKDFSALEPGVVEFKYFLPGVGLIAETDPESDERLELIEFETN